MRTPATSLDAIFPWETLYALIGGESAIDISRLHLRTEADAERFLDSYGFTWPVEAHRVEIEEVLDGAWALVEEELLPDSGAAPPPDGVRSERDARRLLLMASSDEPDEQQRWACAILRVMHVMVHARTPLNERFAPRIRQQIIDRFTPHLHQVDGQLMLGSGEAAVPLMRFDVRASKALRSVAMKLAHKRENVGADVFDRLGVRFVTEHPFDALLVVRYLRVNSVIMFANIKPSRSRNTLIDLPGLRARMLALDVEVAEGRTTLETAYATLRAWCQGTDGPMPSFEANQHTATDYRSIQFTCRQQIRIPTADGELRFFFPFEVQVMDRESFDETRDGRASHTEYKARQRATVRRRILRDLIP